MKDVLKIAHIPGVEPEEQPTVREVDVAIDVRGSQDGKVLGQFGSQVEIAKPAGQLASEVRKFCINCKHFDQHKAMAVFLEAEKTAEGQQELRHLKANLLQLGGSNLSTVGSYGSLDDFRDLGYCHAWSSVGKDMIVHPLSNCPTESPGWGDRFEAIDRAAKKRGGKAYDEIMLRAEGKIN